MLNFLLYAKLKMTMVMTRDIMQSISKSKLKSKLLELLRYVESEGEEIIVTDRGKPVIKISRYYDAPTTKELFGQMRGNVKYTEDIITPTTEEWEKI